MRLLRWLPLAAVLAGCGQTGPLYLPDEDIQTPVEIRAPEQDEESDPAGGD